MKLLSSLAAVTLLGLASVASAQINMPSPNTPGGSMTTAVRLVVTSDLMLDRSIKRWIRTHYPGWDAEPYEIQEMGDERYAVVYIKSANNPGRRVYFRVASSQRDSDDSGFPQL